MSGILSKHVEERIHIGSPLFQSASAFPAQAAYLRLVIPEQGPSPIKQIRCLNS